MEKWRGGIKSQLGNEGHHEGTVGLRGVLGVRETLDYSGVLSWPLMNFSLSHSLNFGVCWDSTLVLSYFLLSLADLVSLSTCISHLGWTLPISPQFTILPLTSGPVYKSGPFSDSASHPCVCTLVDFPDFCTTAFISDSPPLCLVLSFHYSFGGSAWLLDSVSLKTHTHTHTLGSPLTAKAKVSQPMFLTPIPMCGFFFLSPSNSPTPASVSSDPTRRQHQLPQLRAQSHKVAQTSDANHI